MDTDGFGIPISMRQMNGGLFNHSVHLSGLSWTVQLEKSGAQSPAAVARFVRPSLGGLLNKTG
jgi:hypothetical protein